MEIRKTTLFAPSLTPPVRPPVVERKPAEGRQDRQTAPAGLGGEAEDEINERRKFALRGLEGGSDPALRPDAPPSRLPASPDYATRRALEAYQAQVQVQDDERAMLSNLLGVDYYA